MLHQFICSQEQIDLTVDGIVYKLQKSDHFWSFPALLWLATCAKVNGDWSIQQEVDKLFRKSQNFQIFYQMNWFMLANELIQHSRNTSIATAVNRKSTTTSLNLYLITLLLSLGIKHNKQALQKGSLGSYSLPIWGAKCYKQMKFKQKLANIFLMTYPTPLSNILHEPNKKTLHETYIQSSN